MVFLVGTEVSNLFFQGYTFGTGVLKHPFLKFFSYGFKKIGFMGDYTQLKTGINFEINLN